MTVTMYEYTFYDGYVMRFYSPLTFTLLKMAVNLHKGLRNMKKVEVNKDED